MTLRIDRPCARLAAAALLLATVAAGCSDATSPAERARLALDAVVLAPPVPGGFATRAVQLTVRHGGGPAVALTGCPNPPAAVIERLDAGAWRDAGSIGIICLGIHRPSTVALGRGGEQTVSIVPPGPGRYRFTVLVGPDMAEPERRLRSAEVVVP